jgi:hypothetical protein
MKLSFRQGALFESYKSKPVINFSKQSIEASIELRSLASEYFINKIDPTDVEAWGVDEDMYSGLRIKQSGVDLITYDLDTQEFRFFDKKAIEEGDFVRGADGRVRITDDFLDRSNQVDASYAPEIDPENPKLSKVYYEKFMKAMSAADDKHKQRNNDHFTLFRGKITDLPEELRASVNIDTHTEVYTNRTLYYVIDQDKKGTYNLSYYVPAWRDGESFIPAPLHDPLNIRRVKHVLGKRLSYMDAVNKLQEHWQGFASHQVSVKRQKKNDKLDVRDVVSDLQGKSEVLFEEEHNLCYGDLAKKW